MAGEWRVMYASSSSAVDRRRALATGRFGYRSKAERATSPSGLPFVRAATSMFGYASIDGDSPSCHDEQPNDSAARYRLKPAIGLLASKGTVGHVGIRAARMRRRCVTVQQLD